MKPLGLLKSVGLSVAALVGAHAAVAQEVRLHTSPKLMLRTGGGLYRNAANKSSKNAPSIGGLNVAFHYFLTPNLSAGIGYKAEFDILRSTMPFRGFDVSGRWYPFTQGTHLYKELGDTKLEFHDTSASYIVANFAQRNYFLATDTSTNITEQNVLKGSFAAIELGVGTDVRMSRQFELNFEVITSLFALASTDPDVRITTTSFAFGINYVW